MEPVSLALTAGQAVAGGIAGAQKAKGEQMRAEANAYIGRTRAIQTEATELENLGAEMGSMRAALAANEQRPGVGTLEVVRELRRVRDRERRIKAGNEMQSYYDWRTQANNAKSKASSSLILGGLKAGPSLFDLYEYSRGP